MFEENFGFQVEEEEDKEKKREIRKGNIFLFLLYFEELIFSLQKRLVQNEISFQN